MSKVAAGDDGADDVDRLEGAAVLQAGEEDKALERCPGDIAMLHLSGDEGKGEGMQFLVKRRLVVYLADQSLSGSLLGGRQTQVKGQILVCTWSA